ncbi:hypothetical protein LTR35_018244 [Friedmanniomyces endolithicus]|nr:hypothetical protein LTR35_018244 [Friedmanniomyces endolithicus]KAK0260977.1 hypothetical protein LTS00_018158 [Friedmanniomyces endolithicus]KAK0971428.1 hypothetical protein LTR54_017793 [Friedmanniomyces endolithicus]
MDNIIFYPGTPVQKCRRTQPASAPDAGSERTGSLLTAAREASTTAICDRVQRAGAGERPTSAAPTPMNADCVTGLPSGEAPTAIPTIPLTNAMPADASASPAASESAGVADALSTFIATFGDETHDGQELVDAWQTAAWSSDGGFWHDMSLDDSLAAHQPVSDNRSDPHGDAQDGHRIEPRIEAPLDVQKPGSAGADTDGHGGICPAHRRRLDVESLAGPLVANSRLRAESAQPICHGDEMPCLAPLHSQSIAAALRAERLQQCLSVGSAVRVTFPSCSQAIRWAWQTMRRQGLLSSVAVPSLSMRTILAEALPRSTRPATQRITEATMKAPPTSQDGGMRGRDISLPASAMPARVMRPAGRIRVPRRYSIRLLVGRGKVRIPVHNVVGRLNVDAQRVHESAKPHEKRLACPRLRSPTNPGGQSIGSSIVGAEKASFSTG